jgi:hypothetical protein
VPAHREEGCDCSHRVRLAKSIERNASPNGDTRHRTTARERSSRLCRCGNRGPRTRAAITEIERCALERRLLEIVRCAFERPQAVCSTRAVAALVVHAADPRRLELAARRRPRRMNHAAHFLADLAFERHTARRHFVRAAHRGAIRGELHRELGWREPAGRRVRFAPIERGAKVRTARAAVEARIPFFLAAQGGDTTRFRAAAPRARARDSGRTRSRAAFAPAFDSRARKGAGCRRECRGLWRARSRR